MYIVCELPKAGGEVEREGGVSKASKRNMKKKKKAPLSIYWRAFCEPLLLYYTASSFLLSFFFLNTYIKPHFICFPKAKAKEWFKCHF